MEAFLQPICPATSTAAPVAPTMQDPVHVAPNDPQTRHPRNYAIIYLVAAALVFLAFPVFILQKDLRNRYRERTKKRALIMKIKSKQAVSTGATKDSNASPLLEEKPTPKVVVVVEPKEAEEESMLKKHKNSERRKVSKGRPGNARSSSGRSTSRGKPPSTAAHNPASKTIPLVSQESVDTPIHLEIPAEVQANVEVEQSSLPTPALSVAPELHEVSSMESLSRNEIDESHTTSEVPEQNASPTTDDDTPRVSNNPSFSSAHMPSIASPMSKPAIISSLTTPPASPAMSEASSRSPRKNSTSTSATAPSTAAPLTPASIPACIIPLADEEANWDRAESSSGDPAWDWDGQAAAYSPPKARKPEPSTPPPSLPSVPTLPSLVFPTLNDEPVPGASPASQIGALKTALEASREAEKMLRREVQHYSKECYTMKWRWSTAINEWQQREAQLQAQINHLLMQVQTLTIQAPQYPAPPYALYPHPGSPFAQAYPGYPHGHQLSPLHCSTAPPSNDLSEVSDILAEAILKRPDSIRSSVSRGRRSHGSVRSGSNQVWPPRSDVDAALSSLSSSSSSQRGSPAVIADEIQEIEFPTLLEKPMDSPVVQTLSVEGDEAPLASASS
ncbi:hypothetical protein M422DRAFT_23574 [Sphaerobolus stellatus SS14]|nr:hypothetical protein M422DRAFT_23574 [Sphaerobolus stellatus SS14]